jgi:hypothetical protein
MDLPVIKPGSRAEWWLVTLAMAGVFLPFGTLFGRDFIGFVLNGEIVAPGVTPLGYAVYGLPGIVSGACFGTVLLRLLGRPSLWLGCLSVALIIGTILFWPIAMMIVLLSVAVEFHGPIVLLVTMTGIALVVGLVILLFCLGREDGAP